MPRLISRVRIALALATAGLCFCALSSPSGAAPAAVVAAPGDTMLPAGWELCVLQGLAAPATQANIDDLDEWQAAEGGSTNNSAAYNPYNTRRTTDATNAPLPETISSNGFPAFSTWLGGCAATVATLLQPNMWIITAALRAGNVAPPGVFLADVDKSQWCAPSADGTPCYASKIVGATGEFAAALLGTSAALSVYTNVKSDMSAYQQAVAASAVDQSVLTSRNEELAAAQADVSTAQGRLAAMRRALRRFAVAEYVSSGLYVGASITNLDGRPTPFGPPDANGVAAQQYESLTASGLLARYHDAASALSAAHSGRAAAEVALGQANATLASDTSTENRDLARLVNDVATLQTAGACTTVQLSVPTAGTGAAAAATSTTTTTLGTTAPSTTSPTTTSTTQPTPTVPSTTTPIVSAMPATATTTSTTTTTTTTTTVPTVSSTTVAPATTVPTTVPQQTKASTTTVPSRTTVPATPATQAPSATPTPSGLGALQGCIAVFAPPAAA